LTPSHTGRHWRSRQQECRRRAPQHDAAARGIGPCDTQSTLTRRLPDLSCMLDGRDVRDAWDGTSVSSDLCRSPVPDAGAAVYHESYDPRYLGRRGEPACCLDRSQHQGSLAGRVRELRTWHPDRDGPGALLGSGGSDSNCCPRRFALRPTALRRIPRPAWCVEEESSESPRAGTRCWWWWWC
jgi:hypothetical protein